MKRLLSMALALCLIFSCAAILCSCGDDNGGNFPVSIGGAEIKEEPKRVVVLNDAFADIILYVGYDTKIVGRSVECTQQVMDVITSVGSSNNPAIDTITALEPDLVISDDTLGEKSRKKLEEAGIAVAAFKTASTQDEIKQLYIDLGTALGGNNDGSAKGEDAYDKLFDLLAEYNTSTSDIAVTDAYLYLDESGNYCTFPKGSVEAMIFGYNGAINVFANKTSPAFHSTSITDENGNVTEADEQYIRYASPTYLFLDGTVDKDGNITSPVYDKLKSDENLQNLSALKNDRVFFIPKENFRRPGVTFEEILFTMIDNLNKEAEAAEASANPTTAPTAAPTQAPTKAVKKVKATEAPVTEAPATEAPEEEAPADEGGDNGGYAEDNGDNGGYAEDNGGYAEDNGGYAENGDNNGNGENQQY